MGIATTFNNYFANSVSNLKLRENSYIVNECDHIIDPVEKALNKFNNHPSIIEIRKDVDNHIKFSFSTVTEGDILKQIDKLNVKKSGTFKNIPTKTLKESKFEVAKPLMLIWNTEIVQNK